jgi:hypothetical protein
MLSYICTAIKGNYAASPTKSDKKRVAKEKQRDETQQLFATEELGNQKILEDKKRANAIFDEYIKGLSEEQISDLCAQYNISESLKDRAQKTSLKAMLFTHGVLSIDK